jgi:hypothetical protein
VLLDDLLLHHDLADAHEVAVAASPRQAIAAMLRVTPAEMPLARLLFALRWLPSLLRGRSVLTAGALPLYEHMLASGFVLLAEDPGREVVIGFVGRPWAPRSPAVPIRDANGFVAFAAPGFVKGATNVTAHTADRGVTLGTETRVLATDPASRRAFDRYWRVIRLGSAAIRHGWLRAAKRRAEERRGAPCAR